MKNFGKSYWIAGLACCFAPALAMAQEQGRVSIGLSGLDEVQVSSPATPIGQFFLVDQTNVSRPDGPLRAEKSEPVRVLDTISTSMAGKAHWSGKDDSLFAVGPGSALRVNQYVMPQGGNPGVVDLTLVRGGFRSIAGALGQGNNQYRVQTQSARLDINGADFWAIQCAGDCFDSDKKPLPDGVFIGVNSGTVKVSNSLGSLDLGPGQFARVASPPAALSALPSIYARFSASFIFAFGLEVMFEPLRLEVAISLSPSTQP